MKSWADHCSSDDESNDGRTHRPAKVPPGGDNRNVNSDDDSDGGDDNVPDRPFRTPHSDEDERRASHDPCVDAGADQEGQDGTLPPRGSGGGSGGHGPNNHDCWDGGNNHRHNHNNHHHHHHYHHHDTPPRHSSGDEEEHESDDGRRHWQQQQRRPPPSRRSYSDKYEYNHNNHGDNSNNSNNSITPVAATATAIPSDPPFTAHIRNLSFDVRDAETLADEIERLVERRTGRIKAVKVAGARLGIDRETGRRKGFAYVEFGTAEELVTLLDLNDGRSDICGRNIRIDVAVPPKQKASYSNRVHSSTGGRRSFGVGGGAGGVGDGAPDIDGSMFRGGRYARQVSSGSIGGGGGGGATSDRYPNASSVGGGGGGIAPPNQRLSLKLAPRTKLLDENGEGARARAGEASQQQLQHRAKSQSSIFGDAKPRDEAAWLARRSASEAQIQSLDKTAASEGKVVVVGGGGVQEVTPLGPSREAAADESVEGGGGSGSASASDKKELTRSSSSSLPAGERRVGRGGREGGRDGGGRGGRSGGREGGRGGNNRDGGSGRGARGDGKRREGKRDSGRGGGGRRGGGGGGGGGGGVTERQSSGRGGGRKGVYKTASASAAEATGGGGGGGAAVAAAALVGGGRGSSTQRVPSGKFASPQPAPKEAVSVKVANSFAALGFDSDSD